MSDEKKSLSYRMQVMAEMAESPNTWRPMFLHRENLLSEIRRLRAEHARHLRSLAFEVAALERERDQLAEVGGSALRELNKAFSAEGRSDE